MATIDDLNTSITQMDQETLTTLMLALRLSRRTKKTTKMTTRRVIRKGKNPKEVLASMTVDQKKKLIEELEGLI